MRANPASVGSLSSGEQASRHYFKSRGLTARCRRAGLLAFAEIAECEARKPGGAFDVFNTGFVGAGRWGVVHVGPRCLSFRRPWPNRARLSGVWNQRLSEFRALKQAISSTQPNRA